jgi:hypothetical protein
VNRQQMTRRRFLKAIGCGAALLGASPAARAFAAEPARKPNVVPYSIIRAGDWKLIKRCEGKACELFNLRDDLSEKNDLSDAMPEKVGELNTRLEQWLSRTQAKMPVLNPDYEAPRTRQVGAR